MGTVGTKSSDISSLTDTVNEFRSSTALYSIELGKWPITKRPKTGCQRLGFCYISFVKDCQKEGICRNVSGIDQDTSMICF